MSRNIPDNFDWPFDDPTRMRAGMQGQTFVPVLDQTNLDGTKLSQLVILMRPRQVSNVHIHRKTDVFVSILECGQGRVLTLAGDKLEHEIWTRRYQTLYLPPDVPHVAVYPADPHAPQHALTPDLVALENRLNPSADDDVDALDGYGGLLTQRLRELDLLELIDPSAQMRAVDEPV
jgi:uncharacterized RmlC-like cupin family protein